MPVLAEARKIAAEPSSSACRRRAGELRRGEEGGEREPEADARDAGRHSRTRGAEGGVVDTFGPDDVGDWIAQVESAWCWLAQWPNPTEAHMQIELDLKIK